MRGITNFRAFTGIFSGLLLVALFGANEAGATLLGLKQVQVSGGSQVDLLFDGKINKKQIQAEFFKDIVQISLSDTSVYPAKISSVNGGNLTKIFAYQYTPKLVRCRLSVKGNAEDYKDRIEIVPNGKILTVRLTNGITVDRVAATAAKPIEARSEPRKAGVAKIDSDTRTADSVQINDPEQKKLLEKVMRQDSKAGATKQLTGGKPLPSPFRVFGKLAAIIALLGAVAFGFRKFLRGNPILNRLAKNGIGKKKMIEVLSNHYLGPKKSIAVVRVAGRTMVLGITEESINLITQLGADSGESSLNMEISDLEDLGLRIAEPEARKLGTAQQAKADARQVQSSAASALLAATTAKGVSATQVDFSDVLRSEARKPSIQKTAPVATQAAAHAARVNDSDVRARIKSRLEGLKQL
ncbi:MAG: hypothetical protein A2X94_06790 [Bdellovibrionales bacterium GWB1_55_8]|nr:MAG: hypothetical protein A2X94_06790 [Bdellovibrionales bacterium GWB1_55_8]